MLALKLAYGPEFTICPEADFTLSQLNNVTIISLTLCHAKFSSKNNSEFRRYLFEVVKCHTKLYNFS
jgi:hypothetical protein